MTTLEKLRKLGWETEYTDIWAGGSSTMCYKGTSYLTIETKWTTQNGIEYVLEYVRGWGPDLPKEWADLERGDKWLVKGLPSLIV